MIKSNKITAVLFDMDGVLVDARDWHYDALNRALGLFGFEISRHEHLSIFDGLPTRTKLEMLSRERGLPIGLHNFIKDLKQTYTMELIQTLCKPTFHHEHALATLKRMGLRMALASNAVGETVNAMMARTCLAPYFDVILSNQDVKQPKPHPEIYITAAQRLGISPACCLAVEDNPHGVEAARAAGVHVMTVNSPADVTLDAILHHLERAQEGHRPS